MIQRQPLHYLLTAASPYQALIGTGGVGSGMFFALDGNHTLGREESRPGQLLDHKDYCKLHIIAHTVKALLGPAFAVIPASKVGGDAVGQQLLTEMTEAGLDTRYMQVSPDDATLFSVCFIYPDGSGGNLTASNAAAEQVDRAAIERLVPEFERWRGAGIALAAPEVPLAARLRLLELAGENGFLRVAAITSQEAAARQAGAPSALDLLALTDLLAVNLDEAAALVGLPPNEHAPAEICVALRDQLCARTPDLWLSVTAGAQGSWNWDGAHLAHTPCFPAQVASTAGAGDAHLAGTLSGLVAGLALPQAQQLGALTAAVAVTSPHTIHPTLDAGALFAFASAAALDLDPRVLALITP